MEGAHALLVLLQPLIWEPGQLIDCGACVVSPHPPCASCHQQPHTQRAGWPHASALCPYSVLGEGDGNKTELFWGTSKVHFSNQKEFPSFPLMFCLCVVFGFK